MSTSRLELAAREVCERYFASPIRLSSLGSKGGFSGASLWRVECAGVSYCLKAWPAEENSLSRLQWIHERISQARDAGLLYVPMVLKSMQFRTVQQAGGRLWDVTAWVSGKPDFREQPTAIKLEAAATAIARLNCVWAAGETRPGVVPAVYRRLTRAGAFLSRVEKGWWPSLSPLTDDPTRPWFHQACELLKLWAAWVPRHLSGWAHRPMPLQPCHCDLWSDHVWFEGNEVSAIIDFGSMKIDHVAVDLGRLIGSLVDDAAGHRELAMRAYSRIRPLSDEETELVHALDLTGTIVGLIHWVTWLDDDTRKFEDRNAVAERLASLVRRVEKWDPAVVQATKKPTEGMPWAW